MTDRTARLLFVPMVLMAFAYCAVFWPLAIAAIAARRLYWFGVSLICAAVHLVLGDDDVEERT